MGNNGGGKAKVEHYVRNRSKYDSYNSRRKMGLAIKSWIAPELRDFVAVRKKFKGELCVLNYSAYVAEKPLNYEEKPEVGHLKKCKNKPPAMMAMVQMYRNRQSKTR